MRNAVFTSGLLLGVVIVTAAAGCATTTGAGFGSTTKGTDPVSFTWKSADSVSGTLTATVDGSKTYVGQYFEISSDTQTDGLGPLWTGWSGRWRGGWGAWDAGPGFLTTYSGRVVANLGAVDGTHMRCRFTLRNPEDGMAGGGIGDCQLPDGQQVDAQFPRA
jgi:hypothetical protein